MYRPNRIGPWPIADVDQNLIINSDANFNNLDHANDEFGCITLNPASGESFASENFMYSTNPTLASDMSVGIGVSVNTAVIKDNPMISISGFLNFINIDPGIMVQCLLGRLVAAPSQSASVLINCPIFLPLKDTSNPALDGDHHYIVDTTVVLQSGIGGGIEPATNWDLVAFWHFVNEEGAITAPFLQLSGRIGLHRYKEDMFTFDPSRQ